MRTSTPAEPGSAAEAAEREVEFWAELADRWSPRARPEQWADRPAREVEVVLFFDPGDDLARRASRWGHTLPGDGLDALARFAAGLARAEADAWREGRDDVAVHAFEERRFLLSDRILHWAVPWLGTMGRCYPEVREDAHRFHDDLLQLADVMRPAPRLTGTEGVHPSGEDSYGPVALEVTPSRWLASLWSGSLLLDATIRSMTGSARSSVPFSEADLPDGLVADLATLFVVNAARWHGLAERHPGSAALWLDLGDRARRTADRLLDGATSPALPED
jgi:hypothetical protein